ncbi:MAG: FtsX-like permease family protein [Acidobacteria bacterium]|nr:FtsX-like permease family protein [Acidobacteriota bacterium]
MRERRGAAARARRRAAARAGVRRALGSGRGRLARLLLTESVLLSLGGGLLGLLLAVWGVDLLVSLVPAGLPRLSEIAINTRVVLFTLACAVGTGLLFGLAPALQFSNPDLLAAVKDARSVAGQSRRGVRAALVICEFALATVLLVGAVLLLRSFVRLHQVDPGFDGRGVLAAHMWLAQPNNPATGRYFTHEARLTLFEGILARLHELPGVTSSAIVQRLPLESFRGAATVTIDGRIGDATEQLPTVQTNIVSAEYFETMRIPVLKGSVFTRAHDARGAPVVVINEEVARRYLGGMDPIGARIRFGGPNSKNPWMTVLLVSQRTHEIGIRMALGARPGSVVGMVLSYAMTLATIGVLAGVVAAVVLTRFIAGMLFGISPTDPSTFGVIALTLGLTAAVAAVTPARRAARVDPMIALRGD